MRISDWSSDVCSSDLSGAIYGRRLRHLSPLVASAGMTAAAAVIMLPLAALLERPWTASPDAATWTALAALGLVSTAFAYILYFRILATAGATNVLLVTFLDRKSTRLNSSH